MNGPHIQIVDASFGGEDPSSEVEDGPAPLRLTALRLTDRGWGEGWSLRPAPSRRPWMDAQPFAYQCPPLVLSNQWGWQVLCPVDLTVEWDGSRDRSGLRVEVEPTYVGAVKSQFGDGIVTFSPPWLFRTSPGWDLMLNGPTNHWKVNCAPLSGVVETWWLPYTFTINWKIVEPGRVTFDRGEPLGQLIPVPHGSFRGAQAVEAPIGSDPAAAMEMERWRNERDSRAEAAVKTHHLYRKADGVAEHLVKVGVPAFVKKG
jgi:hypothetical protein